MDRQGSPLMSTFDLQTPSDSRCLSPVEICSVPNTHHERFRAAGQKCLYETGQAMAELRISSALSFLKKSTLVGQSPHIIEESEGQVLQS